MKSSCALLLVLFAVGCATQSEVRRRSDLMSYLYPDSGTAPKPHPERAHMQLPLRLGIAFVPTSEGRPLMYEAGLPEARYDPNPVVARQNEKKLLDVVRKTFEGRDWVREIVIIPSTYLTPHGGFENLDQVAQMYGVDVIALASVDQIQYVNEGRIAYLSIIGSYFLPLERNETKTLIDVAAFHVPSRTFLLRAPGASQIKGSSTSIDEPRVLRERSEQGLEKATADLAKNLDQEVADFKTSIVAGARPEIQIFNPRGISISASGGFGLFEVLIALLMAALLPLAPRSGERVAEGRVRGS